jgi:hypothetical protein
MVSLTTWLVGSHHRILSVPRFDRAVPKPTRPDRRRGPTLIFVEHAHHAVRVRAGASGLARIKTLRIRENL